MYSFFYLPKHNFFPNKDFEKYSQSLYVGTMALWPCALSINFLPPLNLGTPDTEKSHKEVPAVVMSKMRGNGLGLDSHSPLHELFSVSLIF